MGYRLLATLVCALALLPVAASSSEIAKYSGTITVGHPVTGIEWGYTEHFAPCDPTSEWNGFDGVWIQIGWATWHGFILSMDPTLDADMWFYTAECELLGHSYGAMGTIGEEEYGPILPDTEYVIVDGYAGTGAFELAIY